MLIKDGKTKLIETIEKNIESITQNRDRINEIKDHLAKKHGLPGSYLENTLSDPKSLEDTDMRVLALLTEQFYRKTAKSDFDPDVWFTEFEMKAARRYDKRNEEEDLLGDELVFNNAIQVDDRVYSTKISLEMITKLLDQQRLEYDFDIQREAKKIKRNNTIIPKVTIYKKNVKKIQELASDRKLKVTTITFNATLGTSEEGSEISFDPNENSLTINKGTYLSILDGYHRCLGGSAAYRENEELDFSFILMITNYTVKEAQQLQSQMAQQTPFSKGRALEIGSEGKEHIVIQQLKIGSDLEDRIASSGRTLNRAIGEVVVYSTLAEAIKEEFPMNNNLDARRVAKELAEFFEYLFGLYPDEFLTYNKNSDSLMANNKMFSGYVSLAKEMIDKGVEFDSLDRILNDIDFSRSNPVWKELGLLDEGERLKSSVSTKKIREYFKNLI